MAGFMRYLGNDAEGAVARFEEVVALDSGFPLALTYLGLALCALRRYDEAIDVLKKAEEVNTIPSLSTGLLAYAYSLGGEKSAAEEIIAELEAVSATSYLSPVTRAAAYLGMQDTERVLQNLEAGVAFRDPSLVYVKTVLAFAGLWNLPRFQAITDQLGLS
jgi:tetratricopeptide (TPR) repeat protein